MLKLEIEKVTNVSRVDNVAGPWIESWKIEK